LRPNYLEVDPSVKTKMVSLKVEKYTLKLVNRIRFSLG
jgi:hypothetical protein